MLKLVFIHGPTAVGKSTVSNLLLEKLNDFIFVDRAYFKDLFKKLGKLHAKKASDEVSLFIIKELMHLNKNILVQEMGFDKLKSKLTSFKNYEFYSFYLFCSLPLAIERDKFRIKKTGDIDQIRLIHEKSKPSKDDIFVDTEKLSIDECVSFILKNIGVV